MAKLIPVVKPTWTIRGILPAKNVVGPSFLSILKKQSTVPEYSFLASYPCILDFTQSWGCVRTTLPAPAIKPATPL